MHTKVAVNTDLETLFIYSLLNTKQQYNLTHLENTDL